MSERLTKSGFGPSGNNHVGQDIEIRSAGKVAGVSRARVAPPVLRTSENFRRATIPVASANDVNEKTSEHEGNCDCLNCQKKL